ncbi:MAG: TetR/AcrR family transcriptional regulator C-terminal domain-containing protein [Spirochaetales bacterium]|nr:TetR/AcrR family transcriptional regulator C-terminal domain-containing protein [Spirochaetales bacterium]
MSAITKLAIAQSLKEISTEKPLNKITVKNITDSCGINRQTFYYHFKDIYDLIEWIYEKEALEALSDKRTYATWQEGFLRIFNYILDNKDFVLKTYHSLSREHLENFLYAETLNLLKGVVDEKASGLSVREEDKTFIANFYKYGFVGLTLEWLNEGMIKDPASIIEKLGILIHGDIEKALECFSSKKSKN